MLEVIFGFLKPVFGIIDKIVPDKAAADKMKADIQASIVAGDFKEFEAVINAQKDIIVAEATGKGWLQNNWRPLMMLMFGLIVANNYIFFPYLSLFGVKSVMLVVPEPLWNLLQLGIGGYVVGRSAEKIIPGVLAALKK